MKFSVKTRKQRKTFNYMLYLSFLERPIVPPIPWRVSELFFLLSWSGLGPFKSLLVSEYSSLNYTQNVDQRRCLNWFRLSLLKYKNFLLYIIQKRNDNSLKKALHNRNKQTSAKQNYLTSLQILSTWGPRRWINYKK